MFESVDCHTLFLPATKRTVLQDLSTVHFVKCQYIFDSLSLCLSVSLSLSSLSLSLSLCLSLSLSLSSLSLSLSLSLPPQAKEKDLTSEYKEERDNLLKLIQRKLKPKEKNGI